MTKRSAVFSILALLCIALAAGCGSGAGPALSGQPVAASPTVAPTAQFSLSNTGSTTEQVSAGAATAIVSFPEVQSTAATLTLIGSGKLPTGVAPLLRTRNGTAASPAALAFVSFNADTAFALPATPRFVFTLPTPAPGSATSPNVAYYIAYLAPNATAWVEPLLGPGILSPGNVDTIAFPVAVTPAQISANQNYGYALYEVPSTP